METLSRRSLSRTVPKRGASNRVLRALALFARRIPIATPGVEEWLTLTGSRLCVVVDGNSAATSGAPGACNDVARLTERSQILLDGGSGGSSAAGGELSPAQTRSTYWAGLVPNGVTDLVAHYSDGTSDMVTVADNGFFLETPTKAVTEFTWVGADGAKHGEGSWR